MKYLLIIFLFSAPASAWNEAHDNQRYKHQGLSGQRYQYNLDDPVDQIEYSIDIDAQMRDSLNESPLIGIDRSIDFYGGGAK